MTSTTPQRSAAWLAEDRPLGPTPAERPDAPGGPAATPGGASGPGPTDAACAGASPWTRAGAAGRPSPVGRRAGCARRRRLVGHHSARTALRPRRAGRRRRTAGTWSDGDDDRDDHRAAGGCARPTSGPGPCGPAGRASRGRWLPSARAFSRAPGTDLAGLVEQLLGLAGVDPAPGDDLRAGPRPRPRVRSTVATTMTTPSSASTRRSRSTPVADVADECRRRRGSRPGRRRRGASPSSSRRPRRRPRTAGPGPPATPMRAARRTWLDHVPVLAVDGDEALGAGHRQQDLPARPGGRARSRAPAPARSG